MYEWRDAKVTGTTRKAFEVANDIAWIMDDGKVRSAYILFASLYDFNTAISKTFAETGPTFVFDAYCFKKNKRLFTEVFGEEAANRFFDEQEEEANESKKQEEPKTEEESFVNKVKEALFTIVENEIEEDMEYELEDIIITPNYSDKLEAACDKAWEISTNMKRDFLDIDVILYCILQNKESSAYKFLNAFLNSNENIGLEMEDLLNSIKIIANITECDGERKNDIVVPSSLASCIEVLNTKYEKGQECPILGRDKEIFKLFNVFSKKTKRNAVLVGEPGVGKTAIIEAVTQSIVNGTSPKEFEDYTVLSLDVNSMIAGTKYRGEFETKVVVLKQFLEHTPNIILFVDEMHQMLGAGGSSDGTVDLSGSLKPILSRDDVVFVGATTTSEYEQIISRDGAFKRRFEVIVVKEPKNVEVKDMIKVKIKNMENYHGVKLPKKYIDYIILCSTCFNFQLCNPDKTLDLCDRSMAICKMRGAKVVTKADIEKVYNECYEKLSQMNPYDMKVLAYHELGHYVMLRLTKLKNIRNVIAVSVVPGTDFLGATISEDNTNVVMMEREMFESEIMCSLAGRVAESLITNVPDAGARSDLKKAKEVAKRMIAEYGLDDGKYKNIFLMDDDLFNEKMAMEIDEKANKLIQDLYEKTEKFIRQHQAEIQEMAKFLMKKKIATSEELDIFLNV